MMPTIRATENGPIASPPRNSRANSTSSVVRPVMMVRPSIWLIEMFMTSIGSTPRSFRKFSRIRSKTTTVSFSE
jgi:hypothetical protein